jgi:hypothetical protein
VPKYFGWEGGREEWREGGRNEEGRKEGMRKEGRKEGRKEERVSHFRGQ